MTFKSVTGAEMAAEQLIRSYTSFQHGTMAILTDTANGPKTVREILELKKDVDRFATSAKAVMALDSYAGLDANLKHDVELIANESAAALEEINLETDPDSKWSATDVGERQDLIRMARAHGPNVEAIRSRLNHQRPGAAVAHEAPKTSTAAPKK